jgi:hypothetical protein
MKVSPLQIGSLALVAFLAAAIGHATAPQVAVADTTIRPKTGPLFTPTPRAAETSAPTASPAAESQAKLAAQIAALQKRVSALESKASAAETKVAKLDGREAKLDATFKSHTHTYAEPSVGLTRATIAGFPEPLALAVWPNGNVSVLKGQTSTPVRK